MTFCQRLILAFLSQILVDNIGMHIDQANPNKLLDRNRYFGIKIIQYNGTGKEKYKFVIVVSRFIGVI